ncbi:MAG: ubiquinol-cytochrome c reductase iron-sulfur subunit [Candidatus Methylomirabilales bacterium]
MAKQQSAERPYGPELRDRQSIPDPPEDTPNTIWTRRDFFTAAGWGAVLVYLGTVLLAFTRFMFPRVLFEPNPVFEAGAPESFLVGIVDERFKNEKRVWIVRREDGLYAMLAICTHLGCTPNWLKAENKFKCPCHGSGFKRDGTNFEGPAPRPLDRIKIVRTPEGKLVVDKSAIYRMAPGVPPDVQYPHSTLKV